MPEFPLATERLVEALVGIAGGGSGFVGKEIEVGTWGKSVIMKNLEIAPVWQGECHFVGPGFGLERRPLDASSNGSARTIHPLYRAGNVHTAEVTGGDSLTRKIQEKSLLDEVPPLPGTWLQLSSNHRDVGIRNRTVVRYGLFE